ncbi:NAD(P)-binding domain-containing protein [Roseomonas sp. CAU 1739]|uniref:NAD(P)-binding domain-containing protein n=1 Tax=Roseomonas sp. CAU 1739 TaxID=3140364 RepID=UPI00325A5D73
MASTEQAEHVGTLVIGGGQAGLAMSEQLSLHGLPHCVIERGRIAERWRSERWDGLCLLGPNWATSVGGFAWNGGDPDGFAPRDAVVAFLADYAAHIAAPVRCGVTATALCRTTDSPLYRVETSHGPIEANSVVIATGPFQRPVIPAPFAGDLGVLSLHASAYRNPAQLPDGAVLVVGAGASGAQIAEELLRAGRHVHLSIGRHVRSPRRYRGRDSVWWRMAMGEWDEEVAGRTRPRGALANSGAYGGYTIDYRAFAARGGVLLGRTEAMSGGVMHFACDLAESLAGGDAALRAFCDAADAHAEREGLDLPEDPAARVGLPDPPCVTDPIRDLDLRAAGITTIIWATGYALDFRWIDLPVVDEVGQPRHRRGVTELPGLYFLGLPWQTRRNSAFLNGVGVDAAEIVADMLARR